MNPDRESKARETRPPGWRPKRGERREPAPSPGKDPETAAAELERVRSVLLGSERARIQRVEERQENPAERARDVSEVLSQAVKDRKSVV